MLASLIVSLATGVIPQEAHGKFDDHWLADFDQAVTAAQKAGKDLLVDFTGSDWCSWCIKLHEEVFDHQEFIDGAEGNFVLVALDYPRAPDAKAKVPNPKRNLELRRKYGVNSFPTILLMTPEGDTYGKAAYDRGGPVPWIKNLNEIRETGKQKLAEIVELDKNLAAAKGADQAKLLDDVIARLGALPEDSPFGGKLATVARNAYTLDADDAQGRKTLAFATILKAGAANEADFAVAAALDPTNAKGLREQAVLARVSAVDSEEMVVDACKWIDELDALGPIHEPAIAKQLYTNAAFWNDRFVKSPEAAKKYAKKALDLGTENPQLEQALKKLVGEGAGG